MEALLEERTGVVLEQEDRPFVGWTYWRSPEIDKELVGIVGVDQELEDITEEDRHFVVACQGEVAIDIDHNFRCSSLGSGEIDLAQCC